MQLQAIDVPVPVGVSGEWRIEEFEVVDDSLGEIRAILKRDPFEHVPPGKYKRLMRNSDVIMSNTPMEIETNIDFIRNAKGNVLINGLGMGMVLTAILDKPEVESVTVIESSPDVIALTGPTFIDHPKLTIINCCAFEYKPPKGKRYDAVWHDIWDYLCGDNVAEMRRLHRKYSRRSEWQGSWGYRICLNLLDRANRSGWCR